MPVGNGFMKGIVSIITVLIVAFSLRAASAAEFEELELPPEGSHRGQILLGFFSAIGIPRGDLIDAESDFLADTTYQFDNETTKLIEVSHLTFGVGLMFEYMPIDYVGLRVKLRRSMIVQRSNFGPDYKNWREFLYTDYSGYFGVAIHATTRERWDFTLTPLIGYATYEYNATPVGAQIITGYSGDTKRTGSGITYGVELNMTMYFSGGFFLAAGFEWIRNPISFSGEYELANPQTEASYLEGSTSGTIDSFCFIITAGYAFYN